MCGIVAFLSKQEPISQEALKRATQSLHHRGPDGQNYWISPNQRVGLGHARLSIIDLTTGEQPIANEEENLHIVVNGEFYDFEQIQADLKQWGYRLRTRSDSEIALHLYDEFGTQCLQRLRGEFAFVLWDERNQVLFAARDRFGIKPLYYTENGGTLYLASEVKALFVAGVPARWNPESFFQYNSAVLEADRTLFQDIYEVPPGHFLLASHSGWQLMRYWDFNYPRMNEPLTQYSEGEYIEKLRYTLDEAIRLRLWADVPVGCYLSGGIDSATVLGMAARHTSRPIQAFTIAFDQPPYDEQAFARETVEHVGANLHILSVSQSDLVSNFADAVYYGERLSNTISTAGKYLLSKATRDMGYKVVLTGEGSDEIFGGYVAMHEDMLLYNREGQDEQTVQQLLAELQSNNPASALLLETDASEMPLKGVQRTLGFVPTWLKNISVGLMKAGIKKLYPFYTPAFAAFVAERDAFRIFLNRLDVQGQLTGREPVNQSLYLWSKTVLPNYVLRMLGDGVEMAHSIEGRLPFLDHHLVELVRDFPVSLKIRGATEKYVLREAARPFLTDTMYHRKKHSYSSPPYALQSNQPLQELLQDTLRGEVMKSLPFYDQKAVIALLDQLPEMDDSKRTQVTFTLTGMVSACILQERFKLTG
ncbi:MAG: asparagine synthase (glutamine-hydrolyzing) [Nostoc sp.]|uniref:asparagine synthase (glutamine-hydrolyzing) n=1 Tax=Nostoc sp. TaxID=1180 RepID=UPI002FFD2775